MIIGLTDKPILRRDGKIRAGYKDGNKLVNTEHFLLVDAPQLVPDLGESPTEIYFTVHSDNVTEVARADLRYYTQTDIVCMSRHNSPDTQGRPMGSVAAYFGMGDAPYVKAEQFPGVNRARVRQCCYQTCPDYMKGSCTEHLFLDMLIPQYSMGAIFTLDSTSINAVLNTMSTLQKTATRYAGKLSGQIFKLCKKKGEIKYITKDGKTGKREAPIVHVEFVPFSEYEANFRDKIRPEDWEALMNLRNRPSANPMFGAIGAPTSAEQLPAPEQVDGAALAAPAQMASMPAPPDDSQYAQWANDPVLTPLFAEISTLTGKDNSEANRIATVRHAGSVQRTVSYLQGKIAEIKRNQKKAQAPKATPEDQQAAVDMPPPQAESQAQAPENALY